MRRTYHHGGLRQAFLDAALAALDAAGELPSWRALARACEVSQTAPYRHFDSFEALQAAVAAEAFVRLARAVVEAGAGARDPRARLAAGLRAYVQFGFRHPSWYELMFGRNLALLKRPEVASAGTAAYQTLIDAITACGVADPARTAFVLWSALHGITDLAGSGLRPPIAATGPGEERAVVADVVAMCVAEVARAAAHGGRRTRSVHKRPPAR